LRRNTEADFWVKVEKTEGCWLWMAARDKDGYGNVRWRMERERAHRLSWRLTYGNIPDGLWVLHRCDNPPCVRPDHLFLGTAKDNTADMLNKGRYISHRQKWTPEQRAKVAEFYRQYPEVRARGERCHTAKLTAEKVLEMRRVRRETGRPYADIAIEFGVSKRAALLAIQGITWKHVFQSAAQIAG
jgi:hypothetical protein